MKRNRRLLVVGVVVTLIVLLAIGLFVLWTPPLVREGVTCIGCVQWNAPAISRVTANRLSGTYRFTRDISYLVEFEEGEVVVAGQAFDPGCYTDQASEGARLRFDNARHVHLEAPAPEEACP